MNATLKYLTTILNYKCDPAAKIDLNGFTIHAQFEHKQNHFISYPASPH